jgi:peptide/nickel transport system permease protein
MALATDVDVLVRPQPRFGLGAAHAVGKAARKNPAGAIAGLGCVLLVALAIFGPSVAPYSPNDTSFPYLQAPSLDHPLGTDNLARDLLSRTIVGARNSLGIAFAAIAISTVAGIVLGVTSGYLGGPLDLGVSRVIDVALAYPALVLVIFLVTIFGREFMVISLAIAIILTPGMTRVVRGATIGVRHQPFVEAATAIGNSEFRIMYRHILPNIAAPIIVIASLNIGIAILIEAAISFLGLGVSSALNPSWGRMLQETRPSWQLAWWTMIVPGLAISIAVLSFNIFGDALRDALDPRLRGSR